MTCRIAFGAFFCAMVFASLVIAQTNQAQPTPSLPPMPNLPPGVGPQAAPNMMPGAPGMPPMPNVGARPMMPPNEPTIPASTQHIPIEPVRSTSSSLISFLDATTPFVQAFDFALMIIAGVFCVRAASAPGLTILAISCFVSAIILLGFFLFEVFHLLPAYVVARLLAPFELFLFVVGLIVVARRSRLSQ